MSFKQHKYQQLSPVRKVYCPNPTKLQFVVLKKKYSDAEETDDDDTGRGSHCFTG